MRPSLTFNAWLRYEFIRQFANRIEAGSSLLEIGCGGGAMGAHLAERFEYTAYEPDQESFDLACKRIGSNGDVINRYLPERGVRTFDVVAAFEVLEHMPDDKGVLAGWKQWVRPGGWLILSVPAGPSRYGPWDEAVGHVRRYTRRGLEEVLRQSGFIENSVASVGFPLGYVLEFGRNRLVPRNVSATQGQRTANSGRLYQLSDRYWWISRAVTAPFRMLQRPFARSDLGTGLVAVGRRPR